MRVCDSTEGVDWNRAKADLRADDFDNGRSADALRRSFECSQHVALAWDGDRVVGMARLLSDGVCNAYLLDVWTRSAYRRRGIGSSMVRLLTDRVPGQHIGLQTDDAEKFLRLARLPAPTFLHVPGCRHVARQRCQLVATSVVPGCSGAVTFEDVAVVRKRFAGRAGRSMSPGDGDT